MRKWVILCSLALMTSLLSCENKDETIREKVVIDSNFDQSTDNWTADLAEYSIETDTSIIEFRYGRKSLPASLDKSRRAFMMQSHNRSDDMFMYLKRKVTGLRANQAYNVVFNIELATNSPANSVGIGGSPGSSVFLKAGASGIEPSKKLEQGFYKFNLDKGEQANEGKELFLIGNIANGLETEDYKIIQRNNETKSVEVKSNANGEVWLCVGTDSGFEGLTRIYYDKIKATITEK